MRKIDKLIEQMKDARYSHSVWAQYHRENPRQTVAEFLEKSPEATRLTKLMGGVNYQLRWVGIYDNVIVELEKLQ